nr:393_t:CDS:2 [Entrophospora candida]
MTDLDLESVYQDYLASLQDLTFNSRPIITNLTIIAQENDFAARAIVQAIEKQIHICLPEHKLPVLYLLDSICKNVGGTYVHLFSRNLYNIFMETYNSVDQTTKLKLEKVLITWKSGPSGEPVFSNDNQPIIQPPLQQQPLPQQYTNTNSIRGYYNTQQQYVNKPSIPLHNQVFIPPPEQQQLLQECKSLILSRQQNPSDLTNQNQITYLQKLSEALQQKFVTNEEIQQIRQMLAANNLEKIQLTSHDIQCKRVGVVAILYDALPSQCKQCGIRYAKDSKKIGIHLDWHFRQNRKMKEKAKKAQKKFQVFWNDNEEEWMFRNAVEINDGIICHATCHADALKLNVGDNKAF